MAEEVQELQSYEDLLVLDEELETGDLGSSKTLSEAEGEVVQKTDLQMAMKYLIPTFKNPRINELLQSAMMSRIFPDNYIDKLFLITASIIEEIDPEEDVDVVAIISLSQDGLSIGYEGRGRIDILEVAGVAHEEELEKLTKELGL